MLIGVQKTLNQGEVLLENTRPEFKAFWIGVFFRKIDLPPLHQCQKVPLSLYTTPEYTM